MKLTGFGFAGLFIAAASLLLVAPGCGTSPSDLCEQSCDCTGCSDAQLSQCKASADGVESCADDLGCGDELDDYVDCFNDNAVCTPGTHPNYTASDACDSQLSKLSNCAKGCSFNDL